MKNKKRITILLGLSIMAAMPAYGAAASAATLETEVIYGVKFRAQPNSDAEVYRMLKRGEDIHVVDKINSYWLKIEDQNGKTGYISANSKYTDYKPSEKITVPQDDPAAIAATSGVNLRSQPKVADNVIGFIPKGGKVNVIEKENQYWLKVDYKGTTGYTSANYFNYTAPPASASANEIIQTARSYIGEFKYKWGAEPWNTSYKYSDCSSFVQLVFNKQHGFDLPRTSKEQSKAGDYVSKSNLKPGDLVFFDTDGSGGINHVGIYVGNGDFIHSSPINEVGISNLNSGYWEDHYETGRRVL